MKSTTSWTLAILLGVSLLVNVVTLTRLSRSQSKHSPPVPVPVRRATDEKEPVPSTPLPIQTSRTPAEQVLASTSQDVPFRKVDPPPKAAAVPALNAPKVIAAIDAQSKFGAFWKELNQLVKVKDKLEYVDYFDTSVRATAEFLELGEPAQRLFKDAAHNGVVTIQKARQEYDAAKQNLPPRDKNNPASVAAYQQEKILIDQRHKMQMGAAVDLVKALLDPSLPKHAEFASNAEKWLNNLVPPKTKPY